MCTVSKVESLKLLDSVRADDASFSISRPFEAAHEWLNIKRLDNENRSQSGSLNSELLSPSNSLKSDNVIITADWLDRNACRNGCSVSIFIGVPCPLICKPKMTKNSSNHRLAATSPTKPRDFAKPVLVWEPLVPSNLRLGLEVGPVFLRMTSHCSLVQLVLTSSTFSGCTIQRRDNFQDQKPFEEPNLSDSRLADAAHSNRAGRCSKFSGQVYLQLPNLEHADSNPRV